MTLTGQLGSHEVRLGSVELAELRASNDALEHPELLRQRLSEDGYLFIRGFHDPDEAGAARMELLHKLQSMGRLAEGRPLGEGAIGPDNKGFGFRNNAHDYPAFHQFATSARTTAFFESLLSGPCLTYDTKWFRAIPHGESTGAHYDIVYMGRGTKNVYTMWSPLGNISIDMGGLAICLGSQNFERIKATYGMSDYDNVAGWFSNEPLDVTKSYGGRWATAEFGLGDALIFSMYTMHASLVNRTDRYRMSCDIRYQRRDEPVDLRWYGRDNRGDIDPVGKQIPMAEAKQRWGLS